MRCAALPKLAGALESSPRAHPHGLLLAGTSALAHRISKLAPLKTEMPGEPGGVAICVGHPMQIIRPGYPGRWLRLQLLDLFATREVIGYADLEEGGGKAVGEVKVFSGAAAARGADV